jgi:hypothetical protein
VASEPSAQEHATHGAEFPKWPLGLCIVFWVSLAAFVAAHTAMAIVYWARPLPGQASSAGPLCFLMVMMMPLIRRYPDQRRWVYLCLALSWLVTFLAVLTIFSPSHRG